MALDSRIVLLIGAETAVVDESSYARPLTAVGNAARTTAQAKYGLASLTFDGTGDRVTAVDSPDWFFGTGDFTVEGWFRFLVKTTTQAMVAQWSTISGSQSWALYHTGGQLDFRAGPGISAVDLLYTWTPTLGQWYHIAADRSGTTLRLYVDGVVVAINTAFSTLILDAAVPLILGALDNANGFPTFDFNGQMDEVRITKGLAQYAGAFTPPTGPFPRGATITSIGTALFTFSASGAATAAITATGTAAFSFGASGSAPVLALAAGGASFAFGASGVVVAVRPLGSVAVGATMVVAVHRMLTVVRDVDADATVVRAVSRVLRVN